MIGDRQCKECGAPKRLVREHRWLSNGTIVQRKNPYHRMIFIECENINATYRNLEELVGVSIEHLLIEAKRKATFDFIDRLLLSGVKTFVRLSGARIIARAVTSLGSTMGYGKIKLADIHRIHGRDDYATFRVEKPYSLPLLCGDMAGSLNAIDRREVGISYVQVSPEVYKVTGRVSDHPLELKERLEGTRYKYKPGDIEIERCPACGGPAFLSQYHWDLENGIITSKSSGHRKAMIGPAALESVIEELQHELGDTVAETVIEAQRRFVKTDFYSLEEASYEEGLRKHLYLRGMGNLRELKWSESGLYLRLENACLHLVLVGLVKGLYELGIGRDAEVEWELDASGSFVIRALPAG
ncbi:MAG: hypothetical protein JW854_02115 [Actinobacteria bacterium]|nr:hypothetical protein [Actinomycetota bacterium]